MKIFGVSFAIAFIIAALMIHLGISHNASGEFCTYVKDWSIIKSGLFIVIHDGDLPCFVNLFALEVFSKILVSAFFIISLSVAAILKIIKWLKRSK